MSIPFTNVKNNSQLINKTELRFVVLRILCVYNLIVKKGGIAMIFVHRFGKLVREKREQKKLTIGAAAEKCGLSDRGLELIELGDSDPKLSSVLSIAHVLEIDLGEISVCVPDLEAEHV